MEIILIDSKKFGPEETAMMQALYSRDPRSVKIHIKKVEEEGSEKFMGSFYVGYGHKSIGDCGSVTICIENVSMFVAKAIQDWPLYSGQEASTRYLDMSKQAVINPLRTELGKEIQDRWMKFYEFILAKLIESLPSRFPQKENEDDKTYKKAIKAKAFDIARGFLPAGTTTYVSWHTNLRQAYDHLKELRHHPLYEVRAVAEKTLEELRNTYPSSFSHKLYPADEKYVEDSMEIVSYYDDDQSRLSFKKDGDVFWANSNLSEFWIDHYEDVIKSRPEKSELPKQLRMCGNIDFGFLLDFGSFRDFQRQRSVIQLMPLLTAKYGFEEWYLQQLPDAIASETVRFISEQEHLIEMLDSDPVVKQYYLAMGYRMLVLVSAPLPAAIYVAELRTSQTVHPTLRKIAQKMGRSIEGFIPGIPLYCDYTDDVFTIKRGKQDIVQKPSA